MCYFIQYVYAVCRHAATPVIAYELCDDECCLQPEEFDTFRRENVIAYRLCFDPDVERIIIDAACRTCQERVGLVHNPYDNHAFEISDTHEQELMRDAVWLMPVANVTNDQFRTIDFCGSGGMIERLLTEEAGNTSPRTCSHNDTEEGDQSGDGSSGDESDIFHDAERTSAGSNDQTQPEHISRMAYLAPILAKSSPSHLKALPPRRSDSPVSVASEEVAHIPRTGRLRSIDARISLLPSALQLPARREPSNKNQVSPFKLNDIQYGPPSSGSLERNRDQALELLEDCFRSARAPELGRRTTKELENIWSPGNTGPSVEDPPAGSEGVAEAETDTSKHVKSLPLLNRRSTSSPVTVRYRLNSTNSAYNPWTQSPQEPQQSFRQPPRQLPQQSSQQSRSRDSTSSTSSSSSLSSLGLSSSSPLTQLSPLSRTPSPSLTVKPLFNNKRDQTQPESEAPLEPGLRQRHTPTSQTESYPPPPRVNTEPDITADQDPDTPVHHTTPTVAVAVRETPTHSSQAKKLRRGIEIELKEHLQECLLCWLTIAMFLVVLFNGGY